MPDHQLQIRQENYQPLPPVLRPNWWDSFKNIAQVVSPIIESLSPDEKAKRQLAQLQLGVEQIKYKYLHDNPGALFPKEAGMNPLQLSQIELNKARRDAINNKKSPTGIFDAYDAAARQAFGGAKPVKQSSTQLPPTLNGLFKSDASIDTPDFSNALGKDTVQPSGEFGSGASIYNPDYSGTGLNLSDINVPQTYANIDPAQIPTTSPEDYYANLS